VVALVAVVLTVPSGLFSGGGPGGGRSTGAGDSLASAGISFPASEVGGATVQGPDAFSLDPNVHTHPSSGGPVRGWSGLNSSSACTTTCVPANPSVAVGNAYVMEVAGAGYRIWTTSGGLILNESLGSAKLFNTGTDVLAWPEVVYDPSTLRWFASVDDVTHGQVYYAGSASSDPTSTWYVQHFNPPGGGETPIQPALSVSSVNVVVATDVYTGLTFKGNQIDVANKSELLAGTGPATWTSALSLPSQSTVPAESAGTSPLTYLVSDRTGGTDLNVSVLAGSPPATPTLTASATFVSPSASPPPAPQSGTSDLVVTGSARVSSAVWAAGELWATANVACTPTGDTSVRSCVHLWEISTNTNSMVQSFNWSTGAGTYDYYPAVSADAAGNIALAFESSSATTDPSVWATIQSAVDPRGNLEPAFLLKSGSGPDNTSGSCIADLCAFGNYTSIAVMPLTTGSFWLAGEYGPPTTPSYRWMTWVEDVSVGETYPVRFVEAGLPGGTSWSITLNGGVERSLASTIEYNESNHTYSYSVSSPISDGPGVQFAATLASSTVTVAGAPVNVTVNFVEQFLLSTYVTPVGAGSISPSGGWFNASSSIALSAVPESGHAFEEWTSNGSSGYSGTSNPAFFALDAPVTEEAAFSIAATYPVSIQERGLPPGTAWSATVNGESNSSTSDFITFAEPNGSYSYSATTPIAAGTGTQYAAPSSEGSFDVRGGAANETVAYDAQYFLSIASSSPGEGSVGPASGWFFNGTTVDVTAVPSAGYRFDVWQGSGPGNYSGDLASSNVTVLGPLTETATFSGSASPPPPSGSSATPGATVPQWELWAALGAVALLVGLLVLVALASRRRRPPPPVAAPVATTSASPQAPAPSPVGPTAPEPWRE
jgi:hypothetical protein